MYELKRIAVINAIVLAIIAIGIAIFVFLSDLEIYYGYAYFVYLLYTSIMLLFVNALAGIVNLLKRGWEEAKPFFLAAGLTCFSGLIIGVAGSFIIKIFL